MTLRITNHAKYALLSALFAVAACGGEKKAKDDAGAAVGGSVGESPEAYRKRQQAFADSVLNASKPVAKVVEQLGKGYAVGPVTLRDTIASLAENSACFKKGRATDPYLAGTVSIFAHMAVIGIDLMQVQKSGTSWTSAAGELVNACLDTEMKNWKLDMRYGKPAAYVVQVQFKSDTLSLPNTDSSAKNKAAPAKKP